MSWDIRNRSKSLIMVGFLTAVVAALLLPLVNASLLIIFGLQVLGGLFILSESISPMPKQGSKYYGLHAVGAFIGGFLLTAGVIQFFMFNMSYSPELSNFFVYSRAALSVIGAPVAIMLARVK